MNLHAALQFSFVPLFYLRQRERCSREFPVRLSGRLAVPEQQDAGETIIALPGGFDTLSDSHSAWGWMIQRCHNSTDVVFMRIEAIMSCITCTICPNTRFCSRILPHNSLECHQKHTISVGLEGWHLPLDLASSHMLQHCRRSAPITLMAGMQHDF